jgi:hypothetical protein
MEQTAQREKKRVKLLADKPDRKQALDMIIRGLARRSRLRLSRRLSKDAVQLRASSPSPCHQPLAIDPTRPGPAAPRF